MSSIMPPPLEPLAPPNKRPYSSTTTSSSMTTTLYTSKEAEERSTQRIKKRQSEIAQNQANLAEIRLLERQEDTPEI